MIDKGYDLMANPSLKAQIEAAKSALAGGFAAPSVVAPSPEQPTAPVLAGNDITTDASSKSMNANSNNAANPIPVEAISAHPILASPILASPIPADGKLARATNAAALDQRITQLEAKLLDNQRDLHALLQKIREVSRLQANSGQNHKSPTIDQTDTILHRSQRSSVIMFAMAALIALVVGLTYFLATAEGGSPALTAPSWISTIIDSFMIWIE